MRQGKCINTYSGGEFWPLDPREDEIHIKDIAHSLSLLCRANGQFRHFYSVGQHSINCANEAKVRGFSRRVQLACLLHDASEAYLGDVTRPVKAFMPTYLEYESKLQQMIFSVFGLGDLTGDEHLQVKTVDDALLKLEMAELMNLHSIEAEPVKGHYDLSFRMMDRVEAQFLTMLDELLSAS
ncbi:HD domain-containing protein [Ferrimonas aestuarii]|uniref:HD domain-containing protein n=1 Tax=Ferrimonas aestuarii TaxID=2569539 RepID=A0A4U1BQH7_9GAMM|nr:HD domain-containing protein [Ferrimonas aestuarii]TKB57267.1 HD domain-containing protein [Ferrimonas aestuarii]